MTSLVDIQTVSQNIAQALNSITNAFTVLLGQSNSAAISATTLVRNGTARLCTVSITTAGSTNGTIYDSNDVASTLRPIYTIPNTIGIVQVNMPMGYGIVVTPGTGQVVTVSYSPI